MASKLRKQFEEDLREKIAQKTYGQISDETVLLRAFKYFDLGNTGLASKDDFKRVVYKIGLVGITEEDLEQLFNVYDEEKKGMLDYKYFIGVLYEIPSLIGNKKEETNVPKNISMKQNVPKDIKPEANEEEQNFGVQDLLKIVRKKIAKKGISTLCKMAKSFRIADEANTQTLNYKQFVKANHEFDWGLTNNQLNILFNAFDKEATGAVDYDEYLIALRGKMNDERKLLVKEIFNHIDTNRIGSMSVEQIQQKYQTKYHPDVLSGNYTEEEVLDRFLDTFLDTYNYLSGTESDNKVTIEEFNEYYENVSMCIENDQQFKELLNATWRPEALEKNVNRPITLNKEEICRPNIPIEKKDDYIQKIRTDVLNRGICGIISLARQFKMFDYNNSKALEFEDFKKAMKEFKTSLTDNEILVLFKEKAKNNFLDYDLLIKEIRGNLKDSRLNVVEQAFDKLDIEKSGVVELTDVKTLFNCKNHRDVKSGKRTEEEIYSEFLETFQLHHNIKSGMRTKRVTKQEFIDYYSNISMSIEEDDYFIFLIQTSWKLNPSYSNKYSPAKSESEYSYRSYRDKNREIGSKGAPFGTDDQVPELQVKFSKNIKQSGNLNEANILKQDLNPNKNFDKYDTKSSCKEEEADPIEKLWEILSRRGIRGIMSMRRVFMIADEDNTKQVTPNEFYKFCRDYRIPMRKEEIDNIFNILDNTNQGSINYEDFTKLIAGQMNDKRKNIVLRAFEKFNRNKLGVVDMEEIRNSYNAKRHPDVLSGKRTEDEVLAEFLDAFDYQFSLFVDDENKNGLINKDDFIDYYNVISMSIFDDDYFVEIVKNTFGLN